MLKIEGLKLAPGESEALLYERAAAALRVKAPLHTLHILRRSIDARDGVKECCAVRETKASASTRPPFTSCRR